MAMSERLASAGAAHHQSNEQEVSYVMSIHHSTADVDGDDDGDVGDVGDDSGSDTAINGHGKRKSSRAGDDDLRHKKKRNRAVLSCRPCKSRKIKCDRRQPCESCIRRSISEQCTWDDPTKVVEPQPFATAQEVDDIRVRLEVVEGLLARIPPDILKAGPATDLPSLMASAKAATRNVPLKAESDAGEDGDGEEAAVGALEELALGHRLKVNKQTYSSSFIYDVPASIGNTTCSSIDPENRLVAEAVTKPLTTYPLPADGTTQDRTKSTIFLPQPLGYSESPVTDFLRDVSPVAQIRQVLKALPRKQITDVLLRFFFSECSWSSRGHYQPYFDNEYENFWNHLQTGGRPDIVDPAWLALLFAMLALASRSMPMELLPGEDPNIIKALPDQFFKASQIALVIANWSSRPQFRVLQTLSVYGPYIWFTASRNEGLIWLAGAVRVAQLLGIHRLGDSQENMPSWNDLAFPTGPSSVKRQLCARLWHNLMFLDATYSSSKDHATFHPVPGANTALPLNCNDTDLGLQLHVQEKPRFVLTDMTYDLLRWAIADVWRFAENGVRKTYDAILEQDRHIQGVLAQVPMELINLELENTIESRAMIWKRSIIFSGINAQIVRLHRPFFYRSFKIQKYLPSHTACVEASIAIIQYNAILPTVSRQERYWFMYVHLFSAVICLLFDMMHLIDEPSPENAKIIDERIDQMNKAIGVFRFAKNTARLSPAIRIGTIGETLIQSAIAAAKERQVQVYRGGGQPKESFGEAFKRLAATVQANAHVGLGVTNPVIPPVTQVVANPPTASQKMDDFLSLSDPATTDALHSLGLQLDNLIVPSPATSTSSNAGSGSQPGYLRQPDSVFHDLFKLQGSGFMNDTIWNS